MRTFRNNRASLCSMVVCVSPQDSYFIGCHHPFQTAPIAIIIRPFTRGHLSASGFSKHSPDPRRVDSRFALRTLRLQLPNAHGEGVVLLIQLLGLCVCFFKLSFDFFILRVWHHEHALRLWCWLSLWLPLQEVDQALGKEVCIHAFDHRFFERGLELI